MWMRETEKAKDIIEELIDESERAVIVVEGKKDKKALVELGIKPERIAQLSGTVQETSQRVARISEKAVIMTDYDRTGRSLAGKLKRCLRAEGVSTNFEFRRKLRKYLMFTFVEEIPSLLLSNKNTKK